MTWKLQAISDELAGADLIIDRDMLVGRHQDADVLLQSAAISRRHAAFLLKDQQLYLQDLNSSNGTFVNTVRIQAETLLQANDKIQFANIEFVLLQQPNEPTLHSPAPAVAVVDEVQEVVVQTAQSTVLNETVSEDISISSAQASNKSEQHLESAVASAEEQASIETPKAVDQDQGMPSLVERAVDTSVGRDGMPQHVAVPKPAPIPEGVDLTAVQQKAEPEKVVIETPPSTVEQQLEQKKNASVGLWTVIVLVIIAVLAWWFLQ